MKSYKILIFIILLLLGLALMSMLFPRNGIRLGSVLLEFPTMEDVMGRAEEELAEVEAEEEEAADTLSPEELMELRLAALHAAKDSEFVAGMDGNPARFYLPNDDIEYLDPLFEALMAARQHSTRIMYFGDSQLECDRITDVLRESLQSEFGGNGAGLLPAVQTIGTTTARVSTWPELTRRVGFGAERQSGGSRRFGPLSQVALVRGNATFSLTAIGGKSFPHSGSFRKISVLMAGIGTLSISQGDEDVEFASQQDSSFTAMRVYSKTLPGSVSRATIKAEGQMEIFGIMLDGGSGVSVDNIAMRGSSGTHFTSLESSTFTPFFRQNDVSLILLQYGGNSVPYLKGGKSISNYKRQMKSQIEYIKRISPNSRIIYVGPADMATLDGETMRTYHQLPQIVDSLRDAALESGVAFWDMFRVMGGRGSMVRWVDARPQLAGEDYIHFTPKGARRIANILSETIDYYYKYYRFRKGLDKEELPADTLSENEIQNTTYDSITVVNH